LHYFSALTYQKHLKITKPFMNNIPNQRNIRAFGTQRTISYLKVSHLAKEEIDFHRNKSDLFFKRNFDVIFSLLIIAFVLSWLLPILAILIKLSSRGPVFFVQERVGAFGKTFNCLKLRTMIVNAQANTKQAQANDPRITAIGKFLRLSCLDELPQFFNVLKGDMSIVGPRPHMIKDCKEFSKLIKQYNSRSLVKPGITGMAQVKGYRGKTNGFYDVSHRFKWDMFYVRNLSFILDVQIMGLTITSTLSTLYIALFNVKQKKEKKFVDYSLETPEFLN
jgi:putative colanic acid biosynthesis UDP-glucose lipid carrier transferase